MKTCKVCDKTLKNRQKKFCSLFCLRKRTKENVEKSNKVRSCLICDNRLNNTQNYFCSRKCSSKSRRTTLPPNDCKGCGNKTPNHKAKYCSQACYWAIKGKNTAKSLGLKCGFCNTQLIKRQKKYCSRKCELDYRIRISKQKITMGECDYCSKPFIERNDSNKFCSQECTHNSQRIELKIINCPECKKDFKQNVHVQRFCSVSCGASSVHVKVYGECVYCKKKFRKFGGKGMYCNRFCYHADPNKKIVAGFRKQIEYKGVMLDSSWELETAKNLDKQNIKWQRPCPPLSYIDKKGKERRYFPDFYLPEHDIYLEPKSPHVLKMYRGQQYKMDAVIKKYGNIVMLLSLKECKEFTI